MEPAGLLSLPVELLYHMGRYLSVKDVLACSQTCHYLRFAFSNNLLWKTFLPEQDSSGLESQEQHVQPLFQLDNCSSLPPLCTNRVNFMNKTRLITNWRNGNFVEHSANTPYAYANSNMAKGKGQLVYNNRYLFLGRFINNAEGDAIDVWDIGEVPMLCTSIGTGNMHYDSFHIVGAKLVVLQCHKVDVYEITLPEEVFPIECSFLISEEVTFHKSINHSCDPKCVGWTHSNVGKYLISSNDKGNILYVWDILTALKIGSFHIPVHGSLTSVHSHVKDDWFLTQNMQAVNGKHCLLFNIEKREFSNYVFEYEGYVKHIIFYDSHVIVFKNADDSNSQGLCDTVCTVHDFNTSVQLKERRFTNARRNYRLNSTTVVNGTFVLLCFDGFHIIDAITLVTTDHFPCHSVSFITHQYNIFGSVFVVGCGNDLTLEVWDIQKKKIVSKHQNRYYTSRLYLNYLCTELVCVKWPEISVLHFW